MKKLATVFMLAMALFIGWQAMAPFRAFAAFSPSDISGLKLWLSADVGATTDGSTPAADGNAVASWADQSGNGVVATQASGPARPIFQAGALGGKPVLRFNGAQNIDTSSFFGVSFNQSMTFFIVDTRATTTLGMTTSNGFTNWYTSHTGSIAFPNALDPYQIAYSVVAPTTTASAFRYDGSEKTLIMNGSKLLPQAATGSLNLNGSLTIGSASGGGSYNLYGDVAEVLIYNSVLTDGEMDSVMEYLMDKYAIDTIENRSKITFVGDSITGGLGVAAQDAYHAKVLGLLGGAAEFEISVNGINDKKIQDMINESGFSSALDSSFAFDDHSNALLRPLTILSVFAGTNDLFYGATATATYDYIVTYSQARRSAGYKTIINTILPRGSDADFEARRVILNERLRANWTEFADGISDIGADPVIGQFGQTASTTYYQDTVHPTAAGHEIIANYVVAAVNQMQDPLAIGGISSTATGRGVDLSWTTNRAASTYVSYGLSQSYGNTTVETDTPSRVTSHTLSLDGLDACKTFHYQIASKDMNGIVATSSDRTLVTDDCPVETSASRPTGASSRRIAINLAQMQPAISPTTPSSAFIRDLRFGVSGSDVKELQKFLNGRGFTVAAAGPGSAGNETSYFGPATRKALAAFQQVNGIKPSVGYFGPITRAFIGR